MNDEMKKPKLQLTGRDGNAFSILGHARKVARQAGWSFEQWASFQKDATTGDYDHLVQTVMKSFEVS
jgi:hypothetical protein